MKIPLSGDWLLSINFIFYFFGACQFLMLPSLSFCFTLFLCKLTSSISLRCSTSQEQGLAVPICQGWISLPSSSPRVLPVVSQTKRWQYPPVLCCLLDFQLEKCMYFPPAAFWKIGPWLRQCVLLSFTCMCYPKATFVQSSYYLPNYFFILLLCLCSVW